MNFGIRLLELSSADHGCLNFGMMLGCLNFYYLMLCCLFFLLEQI